MKDINKNNAEVGGVWNSKEDKTNRVFPMKLGGFGGLIPVIVVFTLFALSRFFAIIQMQRENWFGLKLRSTVAENAVACRRRAVRFFAGKVRKCGKRRWRRDAKKEREREKERARGVDRFMQSVMNLGRGK